MIQPRRALALVLPTILLSGCDLTLPWTDGDGSGPGPGAPVVELSAPSVSLVAFPGGNAAARVLVRARGEGVARLGLATVGGPPPPWLHAYFTTASGETELAMSNLSTPPVGTHAVTLQVLALDALDRPLAVATLTLSLDVIPFPTATPSPVALSWIEGATPEPVRVTIARDPRVFLELVDVDVHWLSVERSDDTITIVPNTLTTARPAGAYTGELTAIVWLNGTPHLVRVPIHVNVASALSGPASLAFTVGPSTTAQELVSSSTVTSPGTDLAFAATPNVPWLTATGGTTGAPGNLAVSVVQVELAALPNGTHAGTVTLTAPGRSPLAVPVALSLALPEVAAVAPVAFSGDATDHVVVRGSGFAPGLAVTVGGAAPASVAVINDTTLHVVPGARAAGEHRVEAANALGIARPSATLHVVDPPPYAATSIPHAFGDQERLVASARHRAVFAVRCWFCGFTTATSSTVQRFGYDAGTGGWVGSTHGYPNLWDAVLTPDERWLVVLTSADLRLVDPATMATARTIALPSPPSGTSRQLSATNDGLIHVQTLRKAWSLRTEAFVDEPWLQFELGLGTSADGSRVCFGAATNSGEVAYRYYDAESGAAVTTRTFEHFSRGRYSRHGERALVNSYLLDRDLALLWQGLQVNSHSGDLSPGGTRAYGYAASPPRLLRVDLTGAPPYPDLAPVTVPDPGEFVRAVTDPSGDFVFLVGSQRFVVVDVR